MKTFSLLLICLFHVCAFAQTNEKLIELTPKEFFAHPSVSELIDVDDPDHHLLTIATFQATNLLRQELGLVPFQLDKSLYSASDVHVSEMVTRNFFDHINPYSETYHTPTNRVNSQGGSFRMIAENIALTPLFKVKNITRYRYRVVNDDYVYFDVKGNPLQFMTYAEFGKSLVQDWYDSIGHRKNLLSKELTHLGLSVKIVRNYERGGDLPEAYAVQNFGAKYASLNVD